MKTLLLFAFFAIVCTVVFGNCPRGCKPDNPFKNGCNNCNCKTVDGEIVCSAKTCPQQGNGKGRGVNRDGVWLYAGLDAGLVFKCKPGCDFKIDCNMCQCSDDGTSAACTLMACNVSDE